VTQPPSDPPPPPKSNSCPMLKISEHRHRKNSVVLQLEGRLVGPWVAELRRMCPLLRSGTPGLVLELAQVSFADENGVALLADLRKRGAKLLHPTPFLEEQLKSTVRSG